jgi:hypothetical protein
VRRLAEGAALVLLFGFLGLICFRPIYNTDIHWHLAIGRIIAETGAIPTQDLFSAVHPEADWVQFQWLFEWGAYLIDDAFGHRGLRVANTLCLLGAFGGLYAFVRKRAGVLWGLALVLGLSLGWANRIQERPDTFNLVFFVVLLPVLFRGATRPMGLPLIAGFAALGAIWAGIHAGGGLLGLAMLLAIAVGKTLDRWWAPEHAGPLVARRAWLALGGMLAGMVVMPGFVDGLLHFSTAFGVGREVLFEEWESSWRFALDERHPTNILIGVSPTLLGVFYAVARGVPWARGGPRPDLAEVFLVGGTSILAHDAIRLAFLGLVGPLAIAASPPPAAWPWPRVRQAALAVASVGAFVAGYAYHITHQRQSLAGALGHLGYDLEPTRFPERATRFLAEAGVEGGIFNDSKWGGYLIYHLWPRCGVFIDGRGNLTAEMVDAHRAVVTATAPGEREDALERVVDRYPSLDLVVYHRPLFNPDWWDRDRWVLALRYGQVDVVLRRGSPRFEANLERFARRYRELGVALADRPLDDLAGFERALAKYWADLWFDAPRQQELLRAATGLLAIRPEEAWTRLYHLYAWGRRFPEAHGVVDQASRGRPPDPTLVLARARLYLAEERFRELGLESERLLALPSPPEARAEAVLLRQIATRAGSPGI